MTEPNEFPPYRDKLPAPGPAVPAGVLIGRAEAVTVVSLPGQAGAGGSTEWPGTTTLTFRIRRPDESWVEVVVRGLSIDGTVREGDQIQVPDRLDRNGRIEVAGLLNLTTGATIRAVGSPTGAGTSVIRVLFMAIVSVLVILLIGVVILFVVTRNSVGMF
ncbi:hypothetical protein [Microlunatus speluncae]|uniref:hypothetical protein n=1 Tax=Microlunatus speluncae TaxID=2594267 RepID=UPI0012661E09|nr:hypothetical protein [Microlunatus speluncae]